MKSMRWFGTLWTSLLLCSVAIAQTGGLRFSLRDLNTDLKNNFGASESTANSINNKGQITGNFLFKSDQQCFYFPATGLPQSFYVRGGAPIICDARGIDATGNIAGSAWTNLNLYRAFRRNSKGTLSTLQPDTAEHNSYGYGISNGIVVGTMGPHPYQAAKWDLTGAVTNIYPYPYADYVATGINSSGQIVGYTSTVDNYNNLIYDGFSIVNGNILGLCCVNSVANAVNANGYIVGVSDSWTGCDEVFVWYGYPDTDLGDCPGIGLGISSDNWIVGYTATLQSGTSCSAWGTSGSCSAFLAASTSNCTGVWDLNTLLDASGMGWVLKEATGINDSHQIVGYGIAPSGEHHAFLLTPNTLPLCGQ